MNDAIISCTCSGVRVITVEHSSLPASKKGTTNFLGLLDSEDEGTVIFQNFSTITLYPVDMA
jgi:hypothetical protein